MNGTLRDTSTQSKTDEGRMLTIAPFLSLARDLTVLFAPAPMRPAYRTELEQTLMTAARQLAAQRTLDIQSPSVEMASSYREWAAGMVQPVTDRMDRRWLMGAAVGSAFSLAGLMALVWRQRRRHVA